MEITVKVFAQLKEAVGAEQFQLTLTPAVSLQAVLPLLAEALPDSLPVPFLTAVQDEAIKIAHNQVLIDASDFANVVLQAGDELALLPPVTGG